MTRWKELLLMLLVLSFVGCFPYRVSVRSDGVMAFVREKAAYAYDPASGKLSRISPAGNLAGPDLLWVDWSPDGKKLLVVGESKAEGEEHELQVGDADGSNFKRLAATKDKRYVCFAQWRPDGKAVTFVVAIGDDTELRQVDLDTGKVKVLAENVTAFHQWHPEENAVVAVRFLGPFPSVGMLTGLSFDEGGKNDCVGLVLSGHPWLDWSPDGEKLLFCAPAAEMPLLWNDDDDIGKKLARSRLYLFTGDGKLKWLTRRDIGYAQFSPDGKHILFVELRPGKETVIGVMRSDGTRVVKLDQGRMTPVERGGSSEEEIYGVAAFQPVWLSNNHVLYYKEPRKEFDDVEEMWAIDINGKNKEDLGAKLKKLIEALDNK